jgi:hypothetical protein
MGRDIDHLDQDLLPHDAVDHSILDPKARGTMTPPFTAEALIAESLDQA